METGSSGSVSNLVFRKSKPSLERYYTSGQVRMHFGNCQTEQGRYLLSLNAGKSVKVSNFTISIMLTDDNMEDNLQQPPRKQRLKWTDEMNSTLLDCKRKAQQMVKSNAPEVIDGNRKKGYMGVMKELWDQQGYEHLAIPRNNLRNHAARLEKSLGNAMNNIMDRVGKRQRSVIERNFAEKNESIDNISNDQNANKPEQGKKICISSKIQLHWDRHKDK